MTLASKILLNISGIVRGYDLTIFFLQRLTLKEEKSFANGNQVKRKSTSSGRRVIGLSRKDELLNI